jgi:outer membrane protein OmpA-like peptidoglycan-associated protein
MKRLLLLSALCGLAYSNLLAQEATTEARYTVSGGLLGALNFSKFRIPDNDNVSSPEYEGRTGWSGGAWVNFPIGTRLSVEPQLMYSALHYSTNSPAQQLLNEGWINYISLPVLLKIHAGDKIAITAGPQIDFLTDVDDDRNLAMKDDFNSTSISLSGGLELFPHSRVSIFGRYIHGLSNMDERTVHLPGVEYKNKNFQVGLKLRLFGKKIEPTRAAPVTVTTPVVQTVVPDSDGDGIKDDVDKCPNVAGLAKYDGCPVPDSDGDGINDELDKCPNQAGLAKYDGCPVPDRDSDGINDDEDKCPDLAGTTANNGCPDVPANVSKSLGVAAQGIYFGTGTSNAKLTLKSNTSLDQVVRIMNENPGLHIRVEGHTDNMGNDDANMKLSEDRANAVKDYLVSKGISADRISAEGFGETQPIADNNTASGRTKNKRIELRMVY